MEVGAAGLSEVSTRPSRIDGAGNDFSSGEPMGRTLLVMQTSSRPTCQRQQSSLWNAPLSHPPQDTNLSLDDSHLES